MFKEFLNIWFKWGVEGWSGIKCEEDRKIEEKKINNEKQSILLIFGIKTKMPNMQVITSVKIQKP